MTRGDCLFSVPSGECIVAVLVDDRLCRKTVRSARGNYTGAPINVKKEREEGMKQKIKYYQTFDSFIIARCPRPAIHVCTQMK